MLINLVFNKKSFIWCLYIYFIHLFKFRIHLNCIKSFVEEWEKYIYVVFLWAICLAIVSALRYYGVSSGSRVWKISRLIEKSLRICQNWINLLQVFYIHLRISLYRSSLIFSNHRWVSNRVLLTLCSLLW